MHFLCLIVSIFDLTILHYLVFCPKLFTNGRGLSWKTQFFLTKALKQKPVEVKNPKFNCVDHRKEKWTTNLRENTFVLQLKKTKVKEDIQKMKNEIQSMEAATNEVMTESKEKKATIDALRKQLNTLHSQKLIFEKKCCTQTRTNEELLRRFMANIHFYQKRSVNDCVTLFEYYQKISPNKIALVLNNDFVEMRDVNDIHYCKHITFKETQSNDSKKKELKEREEEALKKLIAKRQEKALLENDKDIAKSGEIPTQPSANDIMSAYQIKMQQFCNEFQVMLEE
ncbi:hypothetical protein RFI_16447 [Reticulomyxa filosa]|uniref:Uncharacterized protein n=1 Tax=Reticulomyxa filosa TaxID=46433 RepID=X6N4D1_RETFI|nr:hypothetical protein RFI_16447 [Reticulomyxa filosa]|eukprot:ETO20773.1 hypothetical protein RFI_16447 [Reticulomyxa filosa]